MEANIQKLNVSKLARLHAYTFGIIYLIYVLIWYVFGAYVITKIFNRLFQGIDFKSIIRTDIPILESVIDFICFALFGWFIGFLLNFFYNRSKKMVKKWIYSLLIAESESVVHNNTFTNHQGIYEKI